MLLCASCYFYMFFVPVYILILAFTIVVDYFAGILLERSQGRKRKVLLVASIVSNVGVLALFKYYNFFNANLGVLLGSFGAHNPLPYLDILLPIGLSFHTFQAMSYTIEVYRGHQRAERHFGIYALYVMFYPQLVAGPIERPQNLLHQFHEEHCFHYARVVEGLRLMLWGLFKKIVVADRLAVYVGEVYDHPGHYHGLPVLIASYFFAIQIYCDFSGYSDIALGAARVMGFKLMQNFNFPYFSRSIREFWGRWHISLSTWFRDYLYIPLGGNRVSEWRWMFNLLIVFLVSGLWHGAKWTFLIWGFLHGIYLVIEILFNKVRILQRVAEKPLLQPFRLLITFHLVVLGWIFFRANSTHDAFSIIRNIFDFGGPSHGLLVGNAAGPFLSMKGIAYSMGMILLLVLLDLIATKRSLAERAGLLPQPVRWATYYAFIFVIIFLGNYTGKMDFIYFQF